MGEREHVLRVDARAVADRAHKHPRGVQVREEVLRPANEPHARLFQAVGERPRTVTGGRRCPCEVGGRVGQNSQR